MKNFLLCCFCCAATVCGAQAQDEHIVIWDNESAPTSSGLFGPTFIEKGVYEANNNVAELFVYKAKEPNGRAVVVCPGGGYHNLAIGYEGHDMARWLAENGTTAAVLKYRMPNGHPEVPTEDALEALRYMREEYPHKQEARQVGIMGFSAGGHLAAATGVGALAKYLHAQSDPRPDFMLLFYPVITSGEKSHRGSFDNLLGADRTEEQSLEWSVERLVDKVTPPALFILSDDDGGVPPQNSTMMYNAMKQTGIPASLYILPEGGHGWGIKESFRYRELWQGLTLDWLARIAPEK